jgi:3-oxoacyl-[acyl-carrier-protein] synthase II
MKAFIHTCCSISVLDAFENGILNSLDSGSRKLIEPNYKQLIPSSLLRRMSKVVRMGVGAALKPVQYETVKGIIVGTGVGCFDNSIRFSKQYLRGHEGLLAPTDFIQSTDNTIAGQIGLILQNNNYNITFTHKGLAFENALIDAMLLCNEENGSVLVGGVDEHISIFELLDHPENEWPGEGASYFIISPSQKNASAKIDACEMRVIDGDINTVTSSFLFENKLKNPGLVLYGNSFLSSFITPAEVLGTQPFNYSKLCGLYLTNSAFALHLATDIISNKKEAEKHQFNADSVLIINNFNDENYGFIYISKP